jgi:prephenate dehydrogenase
MQISIIGLGQIGTSIGMALSPYTSSITRVGFDQDQAASKTARQHKAIDREEASLQGAVDNADLIILALPTHEIRDTLTRISRELKPGAIVVDTAPIKRVIGQWMEETLPPQCHYIGLTPVVNPEYLQEFDFGVEAARDDLFEGGVMAVVTGPKADSKSVGVVTNLARLLGADPFFVDAAEIDGLMTMTHIIPRLLAAALLSSTLSQSGWREGRKIAGRAYARVSDPLVPGGEPEAVASTVIHNRDNVLRVIDDVVDSLLDLRRMIDQSDEEALRSRLLEAQRGRDAWWQDRKTGDWADRESRISDMNSTMGSMLGNMLGFGIFRKRSGKNR